MSLIHSETLRRALFFVDFPLRKSKFQMRWNGHSRDAKFDGKNYPVAGDSGKTTASLKKIDSVRVEETDHRQGKKRTPRIDDSRSNAFPFTTRGEFHSEPLHILHPYCTEGEKSSDQFEVIPC